MLIYPVFQANLPEENKEDPPSATHNKKQPQKWENLQEENKEFPPPAAHNEKQTEKGNTGVKSGRRVREVDGELQYCMENDCSWNSAVYHEDIRGELIQEASLLGQYGKLWSTDILTMLV